MAAGCCQAWQVAKDRRLLHAAICYKIHLLQNVMKFYRMLSDVIQLRKCGEMPKVAKCYKTLPAVTCYKTLPTAKIMKYQRNVIR